MHNVNTSFFSSQAAFRTEDKNDLKGTLFERIPRELLDLIIYEMPVPSSTKMAKSMYGRAATVSSEIAKCNEPMKILWKASDRTSGSTMKMLWQSIVETFTEPSIFDIIDVEKFAKWVDVNKFCIKDLGLNTASLKSLLPHLEYLDLRDVKSFEYHLLENCKKIKCLMVGANDLNSSISIITDTDLEHIVKLTELESLALCKICMTDAGCQNLSALTKLKTLTIHYYRNEFKDFKDSSLRFLPSLKGLENLTISDLNTPPSLTDACFKYLAPTLKSLNLYYDNLITEKGVIHLSTLTELKALTLCSRYLRDEDLKHLENLINLEDLDLWGDESKRENVLLLVTKFPKLHSMSCERLQAKYMPDKCVSIQT